MQLADRFELIHRKPARKWIPGFHFGLWRTAALLRHPQVGECREGPAAYSWLRATGHWHAPGYTEVQHQPPLNQDQVTMNVTKEGIMTVSETESWERNLYELKPTEWFKVLAQWVDSLTRTTVVSDEDRGSDGHVRTVLELARLSDALAVAADARRVPSASLGNLSTRLRTYACGPVPTLFTGMVKAIPEATGVVTSLRNLLMWELKRDAEPSVGNPGDLTLPPSSAWPMLDADARNRLILFVARETPGKKTSEIVKEVASRTGGGPDAIRKWIRRHPSLEMEILRIQSAK